MEMEDNMITLKAPFFEDFEIGEEIITEGRTITRSDVVNFAGVSGDFEPLHLDKEFGEKTVFKENIAHGMCIMAVASGNIARTGILKNAVAFYGIDEWRFTKPLFFGDTIRVKVKVENKTDTKPDRGIVDLFLEIINQNDEVLQKGKWRPMIKKKP